MSAPTVAYSSQFSRFQPGPGRSPAGERASHQHELSCRLVGALARMRSQLAASPGRSTGRARYGACQLSCSACPAPPVRSFVDSAACMPPIRWRRPYAAYVPFAHHPLPGILGSRGPALKSARQASHAMAPSDTDHARIVRNPTRGRRPRARSRHQAQQRACRWLDI